MGDVPLVACVDLLIGIGYCGPSISRILQLEDTEWYPIDEEEHIGDTDIITLTIAHFKLINHTEAVMPCLCKVYISYIESPPITLPRIAIPLNKEALGRAQLGEVRLPSRVTKVIDDGRDIIVFQLGILLI